MKSPMMTQIINELRHDKGIRRKDVAAALGVSPTMISQVQSGKMTLGDERLDALAQLHGGYTGDELRILKQLEKLQQTKGISPQMLLAVLLKTTSNSISSDAALSR